MYQFLFRPNAQGSAAADFIPFYHDGMFHLFYLFDHRDPARFGEGIAWHKVETADLVHFHDKGEMICAGSLTSLDLCAFTGGVIRAFGQYHIFYTGHNIHIHTHGYQNECIMHAVSDDLDHWVKLPEDTFYAPEGYDSCDFRDPFVYYDKDRSLYYMLLCARSVQREACIRTGETIRMKSSDLKHWSFDRSVYAPDAFQTHECPDLFQIGKKWYLIFSEYSDRNITRYRISDSPDGPWLKPKDDAFDGRAFYAAKTASDGENRYLFGWVPTRADDCDNGNWMWGGNLVVHQLVQNPDGTLGIKPPRSVLSLHNAQRLSIPSLSVCADTRCDVRMLLDTMPASYRLCFTAVPESGCDQFGIVFARDSVSDRAYAIRFDLSAGILSVNRFPCFPQNEFSTYMLLRPIPKSASYSIQFLVDKDIAIVYVNDRIALSVRICDTHASGLGLFVSDGSVAFSHITVFTQEGS